MQIKNFRLINSGCLKASFTIVIPEWGQIEIDCNYFEKTDGSHWINYAGKEYTTKEGKKKNWNQTRWPQPITERLGRSIKELIKPMMALTGEQPMKVTDEELPF